MKAIFSISPYNGLGSKNQLLYHDSDDMKFFQEITSNGVIIMGRNTFESIGKPLKSRINIVVTHDPDEASNSYWSKLPSSDNGNVLFLSEKGLKEYIIANDLNLTKTKYRKIFCIGGSEIFELFKDNISEIYVNRFKDEPELKPDKFLDLSNFTKDNVRDSDNKSPYHSLKRSLYMQERTILSFLNIGDTNYPFDTEVWSNDNFDNTREWINSPTLHKLDNIIEEAGTKGVFDFCKDVEEILNNDKLLNTNMINIIKTSNEYAIDTANNTIDVKDLNNLFSLIMKLSALTDKIVTVLERSLELNKLYMFTNPEFLSRHTIDEVICQSFQAFEYIQQISNGIAYEFCEGFELLDAAFTDIANDIYINETNKSKL